jgi:hypothetical protein
MIHENTPKEKNILAEIGKEFAFVCLGSITSFLCIYFRGVYHRPPNATVVSFVWPVDSWSFWSQLGFIGIGLPGFYMFYTFARYAVRKSIGTVLCWIMRAVLISFIFFLLGEKVAYFVPQSVGGYVVQYDGTRVPLEPGYVEVDGTTFRYYRFSTQAGKLSSTAFYPSELPGITQPWLAEGKEKSMPYPRGE